MVEVEGIPGLKIHDSIKEIKIKRLNAFKKFSQMDAGLGSDLSEFDSKMAKVLAYFNEDEKELGLREIQNIRLFLWQKMTGINLKYLSFACLIEEIDGEKFEGYEDPDSVQAMVKKLEEKGITEGQLSENLENVKKNFLQV